MKKSLNFPDAAALATSTMVQRSVFAEVKREKDGWRVVAGGKPSGNTPWVNLWRSVQSAIIRGADPKHVFWCELDRLVEINNSTALAAARDISQVEESLSGARGSFFEKSSVHNFKEYSKGLDSPDDD